MARTIVIAGGALALGAFVLEWLEYQYFSRVFSVEIYIVLIALFFAGVGAFAGARLTRSGEPSNERNTAALAYLRISPREEEVLGLMAAGKSNKDIARALGLSPNTVKTHLSRVYEKLGVSRRTEALAKAKDLRLIP